ncbi:MAG: SCP2 sterol-binding domain-containing protein [Actinomycetota bacterium]|nr:SCP2 sterol-binding domain-containing protein [Actinomycetota bacterium]MDQ3900089.1 SCP2 sterol-binding domain-containing protein [Actinomycetota bacterium]
MVPNATQTSWQQGQDALREEVRRVTTLLRSIDDPLHPALGQWNLGEVAMHLSQVWGGVSGLARQDLTLFRELVPSLAGAAGDAPLRNIGELGEMTVLAVQSDPERHPRVLADRIEAQAQEYFSACVGADPQAARPWLVHGATVDQSMLTYHLLNETLMHGYDIARAAGRRWQIEPVHAAMVVGRFLIPVIRALGRAMVDAGTAAGLRATYDLRIRGGDRFHFIFNDGALSVEGPSQRPVDCHISADPVAFLLVAWARQSQWTAIATGKLLAWGRKPWLGPQFRSLMRKL